MVCVVADPCPDQNWLPGLREDWCYNKNVSAELLPKGLNFTGAVHYCAKDGATLLSVTSQEENQFVMEVTSKDILIARKLKFLSSTKWSKTKSQILACLGVGGGGGSFGRPYTILICSGPENGQNSLVTLG